MMAKIKIGLIGLGTIGSGVLQLIRQNAAKIRSVNGIDFIVKTVVVSHVGKKRDVDLTGINLTDDIDEIINDPEISIVVELMGGINLANKYIRRALTKGKHVVTANKDLIATKGAELSQLAAAHGCDLFYEASVAGGVPILRTIVNSFGADKIVAVQGIVNGTTNYILTQMNVNHMSYQDALRRAQQLGFAEADPTNDVEGLDAAYKMIILTQFAFGTGINLSDMQAQGISTLSSRDVGEARALGYVIKLIGMSREINGHIAVSVGPVLVPLDNRLAAVSNENNAVLVTGEAVGQTMFYGPGAGKSPTANSVVSDLIAIGKDIVMKTTGKRFNAFERDLPLAPKVEDVSSYFLTFQMVDQPDGMLKLSQVMAKHDTSFKTLTQNELDHGLARVTMITHQMSLLVLESIKHELRAKPGIRLVSSYRVLN